MSTEEKIQEEIKWVNAHGEGSFEFYERYSPRTKFGVLRDLNSELKKLRAAEEKTAIDEFIRKRGVTKLPPGAASPPSTCVNS